MVANRFLLFVALLFSVASVVATPKIQQWQSSNGANVLYVHAPELPMVDVRVVFDAGSARDGDLPGLAMLTNSMLTEGAGQWDADQIAERIEAVGANLSTDSLRDMAVISLRTLTEKKALSTALETMAVILAQPSFVQEAMDRNLEAMKISLRSDLQSPSTIASKAFFRAMYDKHPYAHPSSGTEESLEKFNLELLRQFHKRYYVGANATVAIVGAVDRQHAGKIAEQVVGKLPQGERAPLLPQVDLDKSLPRRQINFPSTQAHLYIGMPAISRGDPDYFPLYVGNHVLGGSGLVSMISQEIREKRGLAYSAYSHFSPMRGQGPFMIGLQTKNSQVEEAEKVVLETLAAYIKTGPSAEELEKSRKNISGGFPLRVSSNKNIVEYLAMIGFYQLPLDYLDTFVAKVNAVTIEDIQDAFKRRVLPDRFSTIVVGQVAEQ